MRSSCRLILEGYCSTPTPMAPASSDAFSETAITKMPEVSSVGQGWAHVLGVNNRMVFFYNSSDGTGVLGRVDADASWTELRGLAGFGHWTIFVSDGDHIVFYQHGESAEMQEYLHPNSEHVIDWFHITMRLTVLQQQTKRCRRSEPTRGQRRRNKSRASKHLLWTAT